MTPEGTILNKLKKINLIPLRRCSQGRVIRSSFGVQHFCLVSDCPCPLYDLLMCHCPRYFASQFGQRDCDRAKRDICSLLGVTILLGITWGLVFFSFGSLTTAGLYPFCILNSLQGLHNLLQFNPVVMLL